MEDAYTAIPFLLEVLVPSDVLGKSDILPPRIATQVKSASNSPASSISGSMDGEADGRAPEAAPGGRRDSGSSTITAQAGQDQAAQKGHYMETLHFFGVFDGHGGAEGALHCAQTLHQRIVEAIAAYTSPGTAGQADQQESSVNSTAATAAGADSEPAVGAAVGTEEAALVKMRSGPLPDSIGVAPPRKPGHARNPHAADSESSSSDSDAFMAAALEEDATDGAAGVGKVEGVACSPETFESALTDAFNRTDEEFGKADNAALVGTTAVVALVGSRQLYVANCGECCFLHICR
jgi:hypothetical protein